MKDEQQRTNLEEEAPKTNEGADNRETTGWNKFVAKRWVFPATYLTVAAIIVALIWVYQDAAKTPVPIDPTAQVTNLEDGTTPDISDDALPVGGQNETAMEWPVAFAEGFEIVTPFFDSMASNEERQAAIVQHDNMFTPHLGINIASSDGEPFEVFAALDGTVTRVEEQPLIGYIVELTHNDQLKTIYHSLDEVVVGEEDEIMKGDRIATAGRNELEKDLGVHLHFEVLEHGKPVNPQNFLPEL